MQRSSWEIALADKWYGQSNNRALADDWWPYLPFLLWRSRAKFIPWAWNPEGVSQIFFYKYFRTEGSWDGLFVDLMFLCSGVCACLRIFIGKSTTVAFLQVRVKNVLFAYCLCILRQHDDAAVSTVAFETTGWPGALHWSLHVLLGLPWVSSGTLSFHPQSVHGLD